MTDSTYERYRSSGGVLVGVKTRCVSLPPCPPSDDAASPSPARSPHVSVLIDAESIDCMLAQFHGRCPRSVERPRWQTVPTFFRSRLAAPVRCFMFLVGRDKPAFRGFVDVLPELGIEPVLLKPAPNVSVVDEAILKTLQHVPDALVLVTHDGDYAPAVEKLFLSKGRHASIVGFEERISSKYREIGCEILDLERDLNAFTDPVPRGDEKSVCLSEFDPALLFSAPQDQLDCDA